MATRATPEKIRQFQQHAQLMIDNGWSITMIAREMKVDASNLSANIGFRAATADTKITGKRPGSAVIKKFYGCFEPEIQRLQQITNLVRDTGSGFETGAESRRIRELEDDKRFLQQQMAAVNSNHNKLTDSHAQLVTSHKELISTHGELSKAYLELTTPEDPQRPEK